MEESGLLGEHVAERRRRSGWGQRELADRAGLSPTTINRIEKGLIEPNWATIRKIADAFEIPVGELVSPKESPPESPREVLEELRRNGVLNIEVTTDNAPDPRGLDAVDDVFVSNIAEAINEANVAPGDAYGVYVFHKTPEGSKQGARITPQRPVHGLIPDPGV